MDGEYKELTHINIQYCKMMQYTITWVTAVTRATAVTRVTAVTRATAVTWATVIEEVKNCFAELFNSLHFLPKISLFLTKSQLFKVNYNYIM